MNPWGLTRREEEAMATLAKCGSSKLVGRELGISHRTVETHLARVRAKMMVPNILLAVVQWDRYAIARMME